MSDDVIEILNSRVLVSLNIAYNTSITDEALIKLIEKNGKNLRVLNAEGCVQLTEKSFESIMANCPSIEELALWGVSQSKLSSIAKLKKLQKLSLRGCELLTNKCIKTLLNYCGVVHELDLSECNITDAELKKIASIPSLSTLALDGCRRVTDKGILQLLSCYRLQNLSIARDILLFLSIPAFVSLCFPSSFIYCMFQMVR